MSYPEAIVRLLSCLFYWRTWAGMVLMFILSCFFAWILPESVPKISLIFISTSVGFFAGFIWAMLHEIHSLD